MSFATVRRDIEKRFDTNWATTVVKWDNVDFTPPKGNYWVDFSIRDGATNRKNIGAQGTFRHFGFISAQIYAPKGTGTQTIREHADSIASIFRDVKFNGITCQEAEVVNVGEQGPYYQMNLIVPFYWDGTYTAT